MKKLKLILLGVLLSLSLVNCSNSDDDALGESSHKLVGTWKSDESNSDDITMTITSNRVTFVYHGHGNQGEDIADVGSWKVSENTFVVNWDESDEGLEVWKAEILQLDDRILKWKDLREDTTEIYHRQK